jgi:EAL domain-containing protein (putative c-di-GMP-specific phosphodiesterase class I)
MSPGFVSAGPDHTALVRSILKLSEALHLETVAEGIEEAGQLAGPQTLGADLGQGYFFARPLGPEAISALLATQGGQIDGASVECDVA